MCRGFRRWSVWGHLREGPSLHRIVYSIGRPVHPLGIDRHVSTWHVAEVLQVLGRLILLEAGQDVIKQLPYGTINLLRRPTLLKDVPDALFNHGMGGTGVGVVPQQVHHPVHQVFAQDQGDTASGPQPGKEIQDLCHPGRVGNPVPRRTPTHPITKASQQGRCHRICLTLKKSGGKPIIQMVCHDGNISLIQAQVGCGSGGDFGPLPDGP